MLTLTAGGVFITQYHPGSNPMYTQVGEDITVQGRGTHRVIPCCGGRITNTDFQC